MKNSALFGATIALTAVSLVSAEWATLVAKEEPTIISDPWTCATEDLRQYFQVPKPTGSLLDALNSYGHEIGKPCTFTGTDILDCPLPGSSWCGFSTAAPSTVLADYSSFLSVASSWWAERSSSAAVLSTECPNSWAKASMDIFLGRPWLNNTVAWAECGAEAQTTSGSPGTTSTSAPSTGATGNAPTPTGTTSSASTTTAAPNGAMGRQDDVVMSLIAGAGLAAAMANAVW